MKVLAIFLILTFFGYLEAAETDKMINCYYHVRSFKRFGVGKFVPENIDPFSCTHISFAFFGINETGLFKDPNKEINLEHDFIRRTIHLKFKNPKLKIYAVLGGEKEKGQTFSEMAASFELRQKFIDSTATFLQRHAFDGLDFRWLYPGFNGALADRYNYAALVKQFKETFDLLKLDFGITVSGNASYAEKWYDVPLLVKYVDFINVISYNFTNGDLAVYDSPLYGEGEANANASISFWLESGAPASLLNMGISLVGHAFLVEDKYKGKPNSPSFGMYWTGRITYKYNYWGYVDACQFASEMSNQAQFVFDTSLGASYMLVSKKIWMSYHTPRTIEMKIDYVLERGLKGIMVWSLEYDDFLGRCGEKFHLVQFASRKLDKRYQCSSGRCCRISQQLMAMCYREYVHDDGTTIV
ncbi:acidic mammalian chitinase [Stomoxys calcitrans]|uniref:acidic mammalian chitinase n=1 Tax=Stomoxys calcitrans TaxID=35570 RepID=UPI0027E2943F|nr:acidic mammalian chitinase [Stomoxys calcitrans]